MKTIPRSHTAQTLVMHSRGEQSLAGFKRFEGFDLRISDSIISKTALLGVTEADADVFHVPAVASCEELTK